MHPISIHQTKNTISNPVLVILTGHSPNDKRRVRNRKILKFLCNTAVQQGFDVCITTPRKIRNRRDGTCQIFTWGMDNQDFSLYGTWVNIYQPLWIDMVLISDIRRRRHQYQQFVQSISRAGGYCLNGILPDKNKVFQALTMSDLKHACIPETQEVFEASDVVRMLRKLRTIWLKPVRGTGGRGVLRIMKTKGPLYEVHLGQRSGKVFFKGDRRAFKQMLNEHLRKNRYISQVHIPARKTSDDRIVDIRITVCRGENGTWSVIGTTLRKGPRHGIVTNYHAGGETCSIESPEYQRWLHEAGISQNDITRAQQAALDIADALVKSFPQISTLGIDISPTKSCCYAYDCNSRPGRDILTDSEIRRLVHQWVQFALYTDRVRSGHKLQIQTRTIYR